MSVDPLVKFLIVEIRNMFLEISGNGKRASGVGFGLSVWLSE